MSTSSPSDKNTIGAILSRKYRSMILFIAILLVGLWVTLSAYVLNNLYREVMDRMYSWVLVNKPRLEEALFLNNLESVGFRVSNFQALSDHLTDSEMTLYDPAENLVLGKTAFPSQTGQAVAKGLGYSVVGLSIHYFDTLSFAGKKVGYLYISSRLKPQILFAAGLFILLLCLGLFVSMQRLLRSFMTTLHLRIVRPLSKLRESMNRFAMDGGQNLVTPPGDSAPTELVELYDGYNSLLQRIREYSELEVKRAESDATLRIAAQVAHDIRSPLAALRTAISSINALPDESRNLIRLAVDRIHDIANNLIQKNQTQLSQSPPTDSQTASNELVVILIEEIMSEKRAEFGAAPHVHLEFNPPPESYGLFAHLQVGAFKRVLSNLINNAAEAIPTGKPKGPETSGRIQVELVARLSMIEIRIRDNGKGIPQPILPQLATRGFTYEKDGGTGLGLYHAQQTLQNWGGELTIESEVGQGTCVTVTVPKAASPHWFLPNIHLASGQTVVIADDDPSIHQLWQNRLRQVADRHQGRVEIVDHFCPQDLREWLQTHPSAGVLFLVDYEFSGYAENGLELIESLGLNRLAVLVTGRYSESHVRAECNRLDLRLLPKPLAGLIPISLSANPS
jgi:signal transduction histidine kinase